MTKKSADELYDFLGFVVQKNLLKKSAVTPLKSACSAVFAILDEEERANVLELDLDRVFQRFENAKGMVVAPNTLRAYQGRVRKAVSHFEQYVANPSTWNPGRSTRRPSARQKTATDSTVIQKENDTTEQSAVVNPEPTSASEITHRFPLRRDTIVQISGIPFDVTKAEMGRMTAFLSNLVADTEQTVPAQRMLNAADDDNR